MRQLAVADSIGHRFRRFAYPNPRPHYVLAMIANHFNRQALFLGLTLLSVLANATFWIALPNSWAADFDSSEWSNKHVIHLKMRNTADDPLVSGRVIAIDQDNGCLLETKLGQLRIVSWEDVASAENSETLFQPATIDELAKSFEIEGQEQHTLTSDHYVVVYRGPPAYAKWILGFYERLYRGFYDYWKNLDVELHEPEFPLVVNVFANQAGYMQQVSRDQLQSGSAMIGYYNLSTNQTVSYDLTESQKFDSANDRLSKTALINAIRSSPGAERTVATIVHEAVHQLAFNSGLQVRLADNPLWLSEGIALFFESPDMTSSRGWSGIGKVNQYQLSVLRTLPAQSEDWITPLIQDDSLFHEAATVNSAYAKSWALTYYLVKTKPKQFAAYIKEISQLVPLMPTDPKVRANLFHTHFGNEMAELQRDLVRFISRL